MKISNENEALFTTFLAFPIFVGLLSLTNFNFNDTEKLIEFYWQIVLFSIILGSLMVNIKIKNLEEIDQESFPRLGFSTIIAGILILIGNGMLGFSSKIPSTAQKFLYIPGQFFSLFGTFFLAVCISGLLMVAGRTILVLKK